jgi:hypothetical protein
VSVRDELLDVCERELPEQFRSRVLADIAYAVREPANPRPLYHLAKTARHCGRIDLWRVAVDTALALEHVTFEQLYYRATAKLARGDWSGWADYEARMYKPNWMAGPNAGRRVIAWSQQPWNGDEDLTDKSLLVIAEGGFGDAIEMLRFLPMVAARARRVTLAIQPELVLLAQSNFGSFLDVVALESAVCQKTDRYVWTTSLPLIFGSLPPFAPLKSSGERCSDWADAESIRVGACWASGSPRDTLRWVPLPLLAKLFDRPGLAWMSLQVGNGASEADGYPIALPDPPLMTFADTAAVVASLDCVITGDTAVAHLAGSLGAPTFLLLPYAADWRWMFAETTPWYPSMRLIRQQRPGDWSQVIETLEILLTDLLASDRRKMVGSARLGRGPSSG